MKKIRRKEVFYWAGDRSEGIFQLERGLLRIIEILPDGRQLTLRHVMPGDYFGEETLSSQTYQYTAEALTDAAAFSLEPSSMNGIELRSLAISLAHQMAQVQAYETHLQWGELRSRICRYLLFLGNTAAKGQDDQGIYVTASHEEIADATASTRESVSKLLSDLRHDGFIDTGYRKIYLVDHQRLDFEAESRILQAV